MGTRNWLYVIACLAASALAFACGRRMWARERARAPMGRAETPRSDAIAAPSNTRVERAHVAPPEPRQAGRHGPRRAASLAIAPPVALAALLIAGVALAGAGIWHPDITRERACGRTSSRKPRLRS